MNSNLPRWTVSLREKPPPIKRSPSEETVNVDKGTIGMSKKSTLQIPLSGAPIVGVFCNGKIHGGQDHVFQFWGGLVNNEAHSDLSWFRPLLGGNSPTSSGLILKINRTYKEWAERSRSSHGGGGNGSRTSCLKGISLL
jgi:hypothetical protein